MVRPLSICWVLRALQLHAAGAGTVPPFGVAIEFVAARANFMSASRTFCLDKSSHLRNDSAPVVDFMAVTITGKVGRNVRRRAQGVGSH